MNELPGALQDALRRMVRDVDDDAGKWKEEIDKELGCCRDGLNELIRKTEKVKAISGRATHLTSNTVEFIDYVNGTCNLSQCFQEEPMDAAVDSNPDPDEVKDSTMEELDRILPKGCGDNVTTIRLVVFMRKLLEVQKKSGKWMLFLERAVETLLERLNDVHQEVYDLRDHGLHVIHKCGAVLQEADCDDEDPLRMDYDRCVRAIEGRLGELRELYDSLSVNK